MIIKSIVRRPLQKLTFVCCISLGLSGCGSSSSQAVAPANDPNNNTVEDLVTPQASTPPEVEPEEDNTAEEPSPEPTPEPVKEVLPELSDIKCEREPRNQALRRQNVRRLVTQQLSEHKSITRKFFTHATPMYRDTVAIDFIKKQLSQAFGDLHIGVCRVSADGIMEKIDGFIVPANSTTLPNTITREYTDLKDHRLSIQLKGIEEKHLSKMTIDVLYSDGSIPPTPYRDEEQEPATGFLDLHLHQTGAMSFNGGWYWGSHEPGPLEERMPHCDGEHASFHEFEFLLDNPTTGPILYGVAPKGDVDDFLRSHRDRTEPEHYLRSDDRKHQQAAFEYLKLAHDRGLNLIVSTMVENFILTNLMSNAGKGNMAWDKSTMESIKRQIISLRKISDEYDWFEVVYDPWHARKAINEGKLAVVIGAEFSNIFPVSDGPWKQQLQDLYDLGLRHLQPVHKTDSQFNSTHNQGFPFDIANIFQALTSPSIPNAPAVERFFGGAEEPTTGLTQAGYDILDEMVRLNMIIDLSHSGTVSQTESSNYLQQKHSYYPWIYSHWSAKSFELLEQVREVGGMVALGWGQPVPESTLVTSEIGLPNETNCPRWQKSLYERYKNYIDYGINFSLSTDMNGFTSVIGPNFGPDECNLSAEEKDRTDQVKTIEIMKERYPDHPDWINQYWAQGTPHIGLLPGVVYDLKEVLGVDTSKLESSTEDFIKMWERAYDDTREKVKL